SYSSTLPLSLLLSLHFSLLSTLHRPSLPSSSPSSLPSRSPYPPPPLPLPLSIHQGRQLRGIRGLFNRSSKSSVDTSCGSALRKRSISDLLLRRTASAPTNRRKKSKMKLTDSSTSISDLKASISDSKDKRVMVERSPPPHAPLSHRPISMPLERLLQGQLSLCSPEQEQTDLGADTLIGGNNSVFLYLNEVTASCYLFLRAIHDPGLPVIAEQLVLSGLVATCDIMLRVEVVIGCVALSLKQTVLWVLCGNVNRTSPFDRPRSHSVELLIESSASLEHRVSTPSTNHNNTRDRTTELDQLDETSCLVIGQGGGINPPIKAEGISSRQRTLCYLSRSTKTESNCLHVPTESGPETTNTPAPSSSSSSSVPSSSVPPLSPLNVDRSDLQSPVSRQDSTISRLIDAVSLGNDTSCGSISALIGQFDLTADQNDLTTNSDPHVLSASQTPNQANHNLLPPHPKTSHADPPAPLLFSSPETTELEEVYTILDEEVLSPVSVYNLREQTVGNIQADSEESTPMGSLEPSPAKVPPRLGAEDSWVGSPIPPPTAGLSSPLRTAETLPEPTPSSTATCLPGLSSMSGSRYVSFPRDRGLYSPISDCDVAYSHLDYNCFGPSSASASTYTHLQPQPQSNTQPLPQAQPQLHTQPRPQSHTQAQPQFQPRSGPPPLPLSGPTLAPPLPIPRPPTAPSPCKSKSLGDLTSEDISCNFHSKYNIISRSFITPCMKERRRMRGLGGLSQRLQSADPLTEQLRKLLPLKPFIPPTRPCPPSNSVPDAQEDSPPLLSRRLSSRSQSRVRHINNRARERQQEALKSRDMSAPSSVGGVVLRTKVAAGQNPPANRHSTGSYIAGYLDQLEDRGLPEGACTTLGYGYGDHYGDHYHDDSLLPTDSYIRSEPEVYFLLRL
ncbi:unnamed protein product, partial [Oncorhynchus mykiss]